MPHQGAVTRSVLKLSTPFLPPQKTGSVSGRPPGIGSSSARGGPRSILSLRSARASFLAALLRARASARSLALPPTSLPFFSAPMPAAATDAGLEKRGSATRTTVAEIRRRSSSADTSPLLSPELAAAPTAVLDEPRRRSPWLADVAAFFRMVAGLVVLYVGLHLWDHLDR